MKIALLVLEILIPVGIIVLFIKYYTRDSEEKYFKKIDFSHKSNYICLYYLSGDFIDGSGHAVATATKGGFLIEAEVSDNKVLSYLLKSDEIKEVISKPIDCVINKENYRLFDPTNVKEYKKLGVTVRRGYEVEIITKNNKKAFFVSKKNCKNFFNKK